MADDARMTCLRIYTGKPHNFAVKPLWIGSVFEV